MKWFRLVYVIDPAQDAPQYYARVPRFLARPVMRRFPGSDFAPTLGGL